MNKQSVERPTANAAAEQATAELPTAATLTVMEPGSAVVTTINIAGVEPAAPAVTVELPRPIVATNVPWRVAIHEAGHACMAFALGHPIETVDIVPNRAAHRLGACIGDASDFAADMQEWEKHEHPQRLREKIMRSLAGRIAEELHVGTQFEPVNVEGESDIATAIDLALTLESDEEKATALLVELEESCRRQLGTASMHRAVHMLALKLLDTKTLSGAEAKAVFGAAVDGLSQKELTTVTER